MHLENIWVLMENTSENGKLGEASYRVIGRWKFGQGLKSLIEYCSNPVCRVKLLGSRRVGDMYQLFVTTV